MRIGITGTQSTGKTTLVETLSKLYEFEDYKISTERSKYLRDLGIPLNTYSNINGQLVFLAERSSELINENVLTDRTIWDVSAFTKLSKSMSIYEKSHFINTAMLLKDQYDIVFYIDPIGTIIENNDVRETNAEYRADINQEILKLLTLYPPKKLVVLHGLTKDRVKIVLNSIK